MTFYDLTTPAAAWRARLSARCGARRAGVLVDDRRRRLRRHARVVERSLEVGVGDERDTARQLGLRLGRQVLSGTAGFPAMPVKNELVRAAMSTAPASAVPIDAPRFVMVFWTPPT